MLIGSRVQKSKTSITNPKHACCFGEYLRTSYEYGAGIMAKSKETIFQKAYTKYLEMPVQVKAAFWFLVCSVLQKGISVITTPIFTRLLSPDEYGQFSVFNSWMSIATVIVTLNLSAGVYTQGLIKYDDDRPVFSSTLQGITLFMTILWTGIYYLFRNFFNSVMSLTTIQVTVMIIIVWSSAAFSFWAAEQRVLYRYKLLVGLTLIVSVLQPLLGIVFIMELNDKVMARILGILLSQIVIYTCCFATQMIRGKKFFSKKYWLYVLGFNLPLVPHYLSQTVLGSADRIMIENMIGADKAGIYGLAYSLAQIMLIVNAALVQTINPWYFKRLKIKDYKLIAPISYSCMIIIAIANIFLIAFAPEAVAIFAPKEYYQAIWVIPPVAMSAIFFLEYDLFSKYEFYYEKTAFIMVASILGAVINVVLNYIFIPIFGFLAAGYTTLFCYMLYAVGHYLFMNKICHDYLGDTNPYSTKILVVITGSFLVIGFVFMVTYEHFIIRMLLLLVSIMMIIIKRKVLFDLANNVLKLRKSNN